MVLIRHYMKIIIIASLTTKRKSVVRVMSGVPGCFIDISSPPSQPGSSLSDNGAGQWLFMIAGRSLPLSFFFFLPPVTAHSLLCGGNASRWG